MDVPLKFNKYITKITLMHSTNPFGTAGYNSVAYLKQGYMFEVDYVYYKDYFKCIPLTHFDHRI